MELSQLTNLIRDINQDNLYNLIVMDFTNASVAFQFYFVEEPDEMRIDNICYNIYNTTDDVVDMLLSLNDIDNPLNIMREDILIYCSIDDLNTLKSDDVLNDIQTGSFFLNPSKSSQNDPNRTTYIDNNYKLPPTYNQTSTPSVAINGNNIKIG